MTAKSLYKDANVADPTADQNWGIYPPETPVRSSIVAAVSDQRPAADESVRQCRYCTETLPPGARECPLCLRDVADPSAERRTFISSPPAVPAPKPQAPAPTPAPTLIGTTPITVTTPGPGAAAVYTLESPVNCPECDTEIKTINVIRVLRTHVSFTSTLPRKAYVISCPSCRKLLSAGLSGLL
jgi:hypothetical protein